MKALIRCSVLLNKISGGPAGYSLCARFWHARLDGNRLARVTVPVVDSLFWFDPQHCRKAYLLRSK